MDTLKPIKLLPARERVASSLRKAVLSGEFKQGATLSLESIAKQLGVSNTPVREAFQMLQRDGFLKQLPNRSMQVQGLTEKAIRDHYETRAVLEAAAASKACRRHADLAEVEAAFTGAKLALDAGDSSNYGEYNQAFHNAIWAASGNDKMKAILSDLWNGLSMGHDDSTDAYARVSIAEHRSILEALREGDGQKASTLMHAHIIRSMENILKNRGEA
jgi:DNA-binding GntR family transcriptional regulator